VDFEKKPVLELFAARRCVYFCNYARYFLIVNSSKESNIICSIGVRSPFGKYVFDEVTIEGRKGKVWLISEKEKVFENEKFKVYSNGHIFTLNGQYAYKEGVFRGEDKDFTIFSISNGNLTWKKIEVVKKVPIRARIENLSMLKEGKLLVTLEIENNEKRKLLVTIRIENITFSTALNPSEVKRVNISVPVSREKEFLKVLLATDSYQTAVYKKIDIQRIMEVEEKGTENILGEVVEKLINILREFWEKIMRLLPSF
jgi:hypothetical protein